jgi:hypothetical protein
MARSMRRLRPVRLLVVIVVAACGPPPRAIAPLPELVPEERPPTWLDRTVSLRTMLGRAGIALDTGGSRGVVESKECTTGPERRCVRCTLLDERDGLTDSALEELVAAFARYPIELLDAAKIERVALCRQLDTFDGDDEPAGLADTEGRVLFVNVRSLLEPDHGGHSIDYIAETAHHEVFHLLDFPAGPRRVDLEWDQLNANGFVYGAGRRNDGRPFGFVNAYATTNGGEDRASTFQFLMARGQELCDLAKLDPTLLAKARVVWKRIASVSDLAFLRTGVSCAGELD